MATMTVTEYDTIAAISTPPGEGAISIVRLSGEEAVLVLFQKPYTARCHWW